MINPHLSQSEDTRYRKLDNIRRSRVSKLDRAKNEAMSSIDNQRRRQYSQMHGGMPQYYDQDSLEESAYYGDELSSSSPEIDSFINETRRVYQQQHEAEENARHFQLQEQFSDGSLQIQSKTLSWPFWRSNKKPRRRSASHDEPSGRDTVSSYRRGSITTGPSFATTRESNLFIVPAGTRISPRADVWGMLAIACAASLGSLVDARPPDQRSPLETACIALMSTSLIISIFTAAGFRYAPSRFFITRGRVEALLAVAFLVLVCLYTGMVMDPKQYIAVGGNSIWNVNLFYSTWAALFAGAYLVGDLATTDNHFGTVSDHYTPLNQKAKLWFVFIVSSVSMSSVTLVLESSATCAGILGDTPFCQRAFAASFVGVIGIILGLAGLALHRLSSFGDELHYYYNVQKAPFRWFDGDYRATRNSRLIGSVLAALALLLNATSVGLVSSSSGPGTEPGSVFITSWTCFALSLLLFKKYVESSLVSPRGSTTPIKHMTSMGLNNSSNHSRGSQRTMHTTSDESSGADDDVDDDSAVVDQAFDAMEQGSMTRSEMLDHLKSLTSSAQQRSGPIYSSANSSQSLPTDPNQFIGGEASSIVSSLGESRFTEEPTGYKASYSYYGGNDAKSMSNGEAKQRHLRQPEEPPQQGEIFGDGDDAPGEKLQKPSSLYADPQRQNRPQRQTGLSPMEWDNEAEDASGAKSKGNQSYHADQSTIHARKTSQVTTNTKLSPLQESSREGSSREISSSASGSRRPKNNKNKSSKSVKSGSSSKKSSKSSKSTKSSSSQSQKSFNQSASSQGSSFLSAPLTVGGDEDDDDDLEDGPYGTQGPPTVDFSRASRSRAGSSRRGASEHQHQRAESPATAQADFDILIPDNSTVVTELTNEGFDAPSRLAPTKASTRNNFISSERHHPPPPPLPRGLPQRMPLYNASEVSVASGGLTAGGQSEVTGFKLHDRANVDALVASALAHARLSRSAGNANDGGATDISAHISTDEESAGPSMYQGGISSGASATNGGSIAGRRKKLQQKQQIRNSSNSAASRRSNKQPNKAKIKLARQQPRPPAYGGYADKSYTTNSTSKSEAADGKSTSMNSFYSDADDSTEVSSMGNYAC